MIAIRVDAGVGVGLGHLARMKALADALKQNNHEIIFIVNSITSYILEFLEDYKVFDIYQDGVSDIDEDTDSIKCLEILKDHNVKKIVVDSYRLGIAWETAFKKNNIELIVIEDVPNRKHFCNVLIDYRPRADLSIYDELVPIKAKKLLGPKFLLINKNFQKKYNRVTKTKNILISLGGGGDWSVLKEVIQTLVLKLNEDSCLRIIVGPYAINSEYLEDLSFKNKNIVLRKNKTNIRDEYEETDLFFGALGTSLYELALLKKPAITFSIAENQFNDIYDLETIGHFLHLNPLDLKKTDRIVQLVLTLLHNQKRLQNLRDQINGAVDYEGPFRVAKFMTLGVLESPQKGLSLESNEEAHFMINQSISVRKCSDLDINHYLDSRNLSHNRKNMMVNEEIPRVEHYNWWFSNTRESYLVSKNGEKSLYIWHQLVTFNEKNFFIGGWFSCKEKLSFDIVLAALKWQLEETKRICPSAIWIAIIKKDNDFVNLLNKFLGFKSVSQVDVEFFAIKQFFNNSNELEFNFVKYKWD